MRDQLGQATPPAWVAVPISAGIRFLIAGFGTGFVSGMMLALWIVR